MDTDFDTLSCPSHCSCNYCAASDFDIVGGHEAAESGQLPCDAEKKALECFGIEREQSTIFSKQSDSLNVDMPNNEFQPTAPSLSELRKRHEAIEVASKSSYNESIGVKSFQGCLSSWSFRGQKSSDDAFDGLKPADSTKFKREGSDDSNMTMVVVPDACINCQTTLQTEVERLGFIHGDLRRIIKERNREIEKKKSDLGDMEFEIDALKGEVAHLKGAIDARDFYFCAADEEKGAANKENLELRARIDDLERDFERSRVDAEAALENENAPDVNNLQSCLDKTDAALDRALARNAKQLNKIHQLNLAFRDEEERSQSLEAHIVDMGKRKFEVKKANRRMRVEIERLESIDLARTKEINTLQDKIEIQEAEIKEWQAQIFDFMARFTAKDAILVGQDGLGDTTRVFHQVPDAKDAEQFSTAFDEIYAVLKNELAPIVATRAALTILQRTRGL